MFTQEQEAYFETFGFLVLRQAFSPGEMAAISQASDELLNRDRQGQSFTGEKRQAVMGFAEKHPVLTQLVEDDRIYEPIEQLLGPDFVWIGGDGNLYVGNTNWHPDGSNFSLKRIKVAFYLDPVTKDTGCLRVIPGSHRRPLHDELKPLFEMRDPSVQPFGVAASEIPCFPLESQPGDVVFFNQNLWHSSFGGAAGRRMFTLNWHSKPTTDEDIAWMRSTHQRNLQFIQELQYTKTGRLYEEAFLASERPRIRSMVSKLVELGLK